MKRISLGISDFKTIIDDDKYFIDKSLIIKEFLEDSGQIVLIPRPRRFGKTLNLSILRYFLEKTDEDTSYLFKDLKIKEEEEIMKKQGVYPVIHMTFKDDKHKNHETFINRMKYKICHIYGGFKFIYESLSFEDKKYFDKILNIESTEEILETSLLKLSEFLNKYYNQKVIILIDEYDTPIHHAHFEGYYGEMIGFMRNFLSATLKDNINIEKACITGILRVAKESIFSGLNNLKVYTLLNDRYSDFFGFTEHEINDLLKDFNCVDEIDNFKSWYNGYIFGNKVIYNPWSTLYYLSENNREFKPYWVNTSENSIIKKLLAKSDDDIKFSLENLYNGGHVETTINEDVIMSEIDCEHEADSESIWSFLLLSGYLKVVEKYKDEEDEFFIYKLMIPNKEIRIMYKSIIKKWFSEGFVSGKFTKMLKCLVAGEIGLFEEYFSSYMMTSFSYFDVAGQNPERVYHAFVLGMLVSLSNSHEVISNRESGLGRYDVCLIPKNGKCYLKPGIIMEFKSIGINSKMTLEKGMDNAIDQINKKLYDTELISRGIENIIKIALVFKGKEVVIKEVSNTEFN